MGAIASEGPSLHGAITAQVRVGRYVLHIGGPHGALVCEAPSSRRIHSHPRPTPVVVRPRSMRGLFGRQTELAAIFSALDGGRPVEITGVAGIGKTSLLRSLAYHPAAGAFADGILYLTARQQSSVDLQQQIFDAFYESDEIGKPTASEIRRALQDKRALILVDDVVLKREDLEQLLDAAPRSGFVVATREQRLVSEVRTLALHGLPIDDAVMLLEREMMRWLNDSGERTAAAHLCEALQGHPLRILQAAGILRDRGMPVDAAARDISPGTLVAESIASIDQKQRRVLLALAALPGVPMKAHHIAGIAEIADIEPSLAPLVHRALVLATQSGHRLADGVADRLRRTEDLNPWVNRAITYYTAWAERYRRDSNALLDESEALRRVQRHATSAHRWGEAQRIGQILEAALVAGVQWDAWAMVLEHCLLAAKATGDRDAEAWALHEIGTRAICVGEARGARSTLTDALKLRETADQADAAAVTRQNLSFVLAPAIEPEPAASLQDQEWFEFDSLPLHRGTSQGASMTKARGGSALAIAALLLILVGELAYWAAGQPDLRLLNLSALTSLLPARERASSTDASSAADRAVTDASVRVAPTATAGAPSPSILIFSPRPGSVGPTKLCYAVEGAVRAVVEPGIGDVTPTNRLTCLRVAPARTTTYQLTALGRDGNQVRQQLVIVVR
jgi:hypothetical protein